MASGNFRKFQITPPRERAAHLVAADELTEPEIAGEVGITDRQLRNWKAKPEFQARVEAIRAEWREKLRLEGLANRQNRIDQLDDINQRMLQVIHERAAADDMRDVPGGTAGVLVHQIKAIGVGANQQIVDEYAFDAALVKELRAHTEQVAKEVGQWADKQEVAGSVSVGHRLDLSGLTDDELDLLGRFIGRSGGGIRGRKSEA